MTAHSSRLPMGLAPLIAEAKQRMRRRRSLLALAIALAGLAGSLAFALRAPSPGTGVSSSVGAYGLEASVPKGFSRLAFHDCICQPGEHPPVSGWVLADFPLPSDENPNDVFGNWATAAGPGPPENVVALEFDLDLAIGPGPVSNLHLPLSPNQQWIAVKHGGVAGYRYGYFLFHKMAFEVAYWSGPDAPAKDRRAILRALESIRPARLKTLK